MSEYNDGAKCAINCWIMAAIAGLVFAMVLIVIAEYSVLQGAFAGVLIALVAGLFLSVVVCSGSAASTPKPSMARESATAPAAIAEPNAPLQDPVPDASEVEVVEAAPAATVESDSPEKEVDAPAASSDEEAPEVAKEAPAVAATAAKTAPVAAVETDDKPEMLSAPRASGADDLKRIGGVGPKLEQTLNDLGVWHFDQIASWGAQDIAWVDERLRFKGRIERDDWIGQAKVLAAGGETAFSQRKK
ncbi:MAG: hypothetical protein AAF755_11260 [Pseudomonadota bacterium]